MADPSPDDEPKIADADLLFRDDPRRKAPAEGPGAGVRPGAEEGGYDLVGGAAESDVDEVVRPPVPPRPRPEERPRRPAAPREESEATRPRKTAATVDQVWSRGAEWGPSLLILVVVGAAVLGLAYVTFDVENLRLPLVILAVGGLVWVALTYPLLITLERPVRMTPEQAVKDFFGALSHHVPHYRRMWLLLSSAGRVCGEYGSFGGFKAYWKRRLAELRGGKVGAMTPLAFVVESFKADKSAGKTEVDAVLTVAVYARGRRAEGALATVRYELGLVRGPDKMWYLNRGTLPDSEA